MKTFFAAVTVALFSAMSAMAQDYNVTVTNNTDGTIAPVIAVDALRAAPIMFNENGTMSEDFVNTILKGDPRPMNGKMPEAIAGPILGTSGPPGVLIAAGETATADMFLIGTNTLRFYAKGSYGPGADTVISGVYDISMGGGTFTLNHYDIGNSEGTNEITLIAEDAVTVTIKAN